ncbi:MAG TPA: CAP domain-containing protein [Candidatus Dormibacteraeota bacterium]|nr:CAP domain-containing protein [Candidatus Dormibacteraeota bacterium]
MRYLSWLAGLVVVVALAAGATSIVLAHSTPKHTLIASRSLITVGANDVVNLSDPAPQHMIPRPSPDPSPTPPPPPPAAPAAPVHSAPPPPRPASPAIVIGSTQQALINQDRARNGLGPLTWNSCLASVARSNAARMAAQGYISHTNGPNVDLTCGLGRQAGENVGDWSAGVNDAQLNAMFVASPEHLANILGPYHYVASAWVVAPNGYGYIAVEFG